MKEYIVKCVGGGGMTFKSEFDILDQAGDPVMSHIEIDDDFELDKTFKVTVEEVEDGGIDDGGDRVWKVIDEKLASEQVRQWVHRYFVARHGEDYVYRAPETFNNVIEQWLIAVVCNDAGKADELIAAIERYWRVDSER